MSKDKNQILDYLLDNDGTTRDINFTPSTYEKTVEFLNQFMELYSSGEMHDQDGNEISLNSESFKEMFAVEEGHIYGRFNEKSALIKHIQLFVDWPENGKAEIELSFFSDDTSNDFSYESFISQLNFWWKLLDSDEVFVRYENASWDYYDSHGLGVFLHLVKEDRANYVQ
jgi:hypothetical protein